MMNPLGDMKRPVILIWIIFFHLTFWWSSYLFITKHCSNISTTPITAMGCRQCLRLSVVHLKGKHYQKAHCRNGVVDTLRHSGFLKKYAALFVVFQHKVIFKYILGDYIYLSTLTYFYIKQPLN